MARPNKPFDWVKLNSYLQLMATKKMCASLLDISEDTIERRIKKEHDCTFSEYADTQLAPVKLKLVQKALALAMGGDNVMLIFSLKNICDWTNKEHLEIEGEIKINTITDLIASHSRDVTPGAKQLEGNNDGDDQS